MSIEGGPARRNLEQRRPEFLRRIHQRSLPGPPFHSATPKALKTRFEQNRLLLAGTRLIQASGRVEQRTNSVRSLGQDAGFQLAAAVDSVILIQV